MSFSGPGVQSCTVARGCSAIRSVQGFLLLHHWSAPLLCCRFSALVPGWEWQGYDPFDAHAS